MSFDSGCRAGASPGANPLRGQKRHEIVYIFIWHLTRVSYHSLSSPSPFILVIVIAIIIVVIIIPIIIFLVYYLLVSSLLLSFMPRCRLVFLSMCECRIIFWGKTSSSISPFRYSCLGTCSWEPCLGTCFWEPILRNVLGNFACLLQTSNLFTGTLLGNLFFVTLLGDLV